MLGATPRARGVLGARWTPGRAVLRVFKRRDRVSDKHHRAMKRSERTDRRRGPNRRETVGDLLADALRAHRAGRVDDAERYYRGALAIDPAGQFMVVGNQRADNVTTFRLGFSAFSLVFGLSPTFTGNYTPVGSPSGMVFLI